MCSPFVNAPWRPPVQPMVRRCSCRGKGVTIPTLRDVLTEFPEARLNIELKKTRDGVEKRVADLLDEHGARTLVLAFEVKP